MNCGPVCAETLVLHHQTGRKIFVVLLKLQRWQRVQA